jgi:hypothetical protein
VERFRAGRAADLVERARIARSGAWPDEALGLDDIAPSSS